MFVFKAKANMFVSDDFFNDDDDDDDDDCDQIKQSKFW